eukprot:2699771-Pyramimonas_sp.AAC.1
MKYLDLYIGPTAAGKAWQLLLRSQLRALSPGYAATIATLKIMCLSVLQLVMLILPLSPFVTMTYKHMLQRFTRRPYNMFVSKTKL